MNHGHSGYVEITKNIIETTKYITNEYEIFNFYITY